jgi:hypothetical protein
MKTIIEMAREAGMIDSYDPSEKYISVLERFAELVRADERERAMRENAHVLAERETILDLVDSYAKNNTDLANAIRERGNT